jgi:hypothetical protein
MHKTKRITFGGEENIRKGGDDAEKFRFSFSVVPANVIGQPEELNATTNHRITVCVARSQSNTWKLSEAELVKVLFWYAWREVEKQAKAGALKQDMMLNVKDQKCAFAPVSVPDHRGWSQEVDEQGKIGF